MVRARDPVTGRLLSEEAAREQAIAEQLGGGGPVDEFVSTDTLPRQARQPFERKPFGGPEQKLSYPARQGYHRHWFNDEPGRIMRARDAGYNKVEDEDGRPVSMVVGIGRGGQPLVAFLMELPQHLFEEDMASQDGTVHDLLTQIGRGEFTAPKGTDGSLRYTGSNKGSLKLETGLSRR
jgi:hypothetical protein